MGHYKTHTGEKAFYWVQGVNGSSHNLIKITATLLEETRQDSQEKPHSDD